VNLATVDLNVLLAFEALFEERSVTRAATRVGLAQPAMSNSEQTAGIVRRSALHQKGIGNGPDAASCGVGGAGSKRADEFS
jgi:hypothetical protein